MRQVRWVVGLFGCAALGGAIVAAAQTSVSSFQESVVVTAAASELERDRVPVAVTVIDHDELHARQMPSLAEVLASVPGVGVVTAGPPGQQTSVFLRGAESDQTLLLWDGVQLNNLYFGGANWQFLPTEGVDRVEVVRGPSSALYGGNAVGGVVQVLTGGTNGARLRLEAGENALVRGGLSAGRDFGAVRGDVALSTLRSDSDVANGFFDSDDAIARLRWLPGSSTSAGITVRANDSESGIPYSLGLPSDSGRIAWTERMAALPWQLERGAWVISGQGSWLESDYRFRDPEDAFGFTRSDTSSRAGRVRALAGTALREGLDVSFGADGERLEVTDETSFGTNLDAARQRTWSAFGELRYATGPLSFQAGLRRDDNDVFGAQTSLRAGAVWQIRDGVRLRAGYGEAFRPPTLGELFFPFSGNSELEPERAESSDLGLVFEHGEWKVEVGVFELSQRELIDFDVSTFTFANIARARSRGLELVVGWTGPRLSVRADATALEAENRDTGLELLRRPKRSAHLVAAWRPSEWTLSAVLGYVGERADADPATGARTVNPAYTRLDVVASWQVHPRWAPFVRVDNATDREYAEALGFPAQGRTVSAGVSLGF